MSRALAGLTLLFALAACDDAPSDGGGGAAGGTGGAVGGAGGGAAGAGGIGGSSAGGSGGVGGVGGATGGAGGGGSGGEPVPEVDVGWVPVVPASFDAPVTPAARPASCTAEFGFFSHVRGYVMAPGGAPIAGAKAQFCVHTADRQFTCLRPVDSGADGVYTVELPESVRCVDRAAMRVLLPRMNRATVYCELDRTAGPVVKLDQPSVLVGTPAATSLPPEGDPATMREVTFDDGLVLEVTPELYYSGTGSYDRLSGRRVSPDAVGLCGAAPTFDGLYAFYQEGVMNPPGWPLSIPNATGLTAGALVDLQVLGGLDCRLLDGTTVPEATWASFGDGVVSPDGSTIESADGVGLPCFTWLGYRLKP